MEYWKDVPEYVGIYQVSDLGNLRSLNYKRTGKIQLLKPASDKKGYLRTMFTKNGKSKTIKVHRIVAETFLINLKNKPQVNHINGDKKDNRVLNLEWVDNSKNQIHAIKLGLVKQKNGDNHHRTKHSNDFVVKIYNEYKSGESKRSLAKKYKVDRNIFKRKILTTNV